MEKEQSSNDKETNPTEEELKHLEIVEEIKSSSDSSSSSSNE